MCHRLYDSVTHIFKVELCIYLLKLPGATANCGVLVSIDRSGNKCYLGLPVCETPVSPKAPKDDAAPDLCPVCRVRLAFHRAMSRGAESGPVFPHTLVHNDT